MVARIAVPGAGLPGGERGFTIVEVLIALLVLMIGMGGIMTLQMASMKATAYSRHATEATVLAEDRMEALRTAPLDTLDSDGDLVDARGVADEEGLFTRTWTVSAAGVNTILTVVVAWNEQGGEAHSITMSTLRTP